MRQDHLTHTLCVRISPGLRDEIAAAAEAEDITAGEFTRRAIQAELNVATGRALDPYDTLSHAEKEGFLIEAIRAIGKPDEQAALVQATGDELTDLIDVAAQALCVVHDETAHDRFRRASGYLVQTAEYLQRVAYRLKAIRTANAIEGGELERLMAEQAAQSGREG